MSFDLDKRQRAMLRDMGIRVWQPLTPALPASLPLEMPSFAIPPLPTPLSLNTRPLTLKLKSLVNVQVMLAPLTILAAGILSTLPASVPKGTNGEALVESRQLADTGLAGQPAGEVSVMVTAVDGVPVIVVEPAAVPGPVMLILSLDWLSPLNAKLKTLLLELPFDVFTICTRRPVDAVLVKVQTYCAADFMLPAGIVTDVPVALMLLVLPVLALLASAQLTAVV